MTQAMTKSLDPQANVTLSGRELAMQRRQAMARLGKVGAGKTAAAGKSPAMARSAAHVVPAQPASTASTGNMTAPAALATPAPAVNPARARREALSRMGKNALPAAQQRSGARQRGPVAAPAGGGIAQAEVKPATAVDTSIAATMPAMAASAPAVSIEPVARGAATPTGRALAQARRTVLAKEGKSGLKRVAQAVKIAAALPEQNWQAAISQGATGRQVAMQHRLVRSLTGRDGSETATRPAGRIRPTVAKGEAPVKVEEGHTLSGQRVTGTMVERSKLVTGNEPGAARAITGTEYIGAEQFERQGVARPQGAPAKVAFTETSKGKTVTGALVGRSPKVTGDEVGATRALTGTAYLGAAAPAAAPEKVALTHTAQGKAVTGTTVGRGGKMTGDERGVCAKVTGTEYMSAEQVRGECAIEPVSSPAKVTLSTTRGSQSVSGAAVGRSQRVTGDEPGACRPITGSQYYNANDFAALCASPSPRRTASVMSRPAHQDAVPAMEVGFPKSVGDAGLEAACATSHPFGLDRRNAVAAKATVAVIPAVAVTGDRPGAGGSTMTGDERGACLSVSGTPYLGEDNAAPNCPPPASGRFLSRAPLADAGMSAPAPADFSIVTPARSAQAQRETSITGTASGSERITGPINKASGLITGTPDFRHRVIVASAEEGEAGMVAASRLSGDAQARSRITGDAWHAQSRVTGTEGASVLMRNPSQRGEPRGLGGASAREFRAIERQPVPESRVTGSSGNTVRGALVTVSGGARA
jgi:hypothetical protein